MFSEWEQFIVGGPGRFSEGDNRLLSDIANEMRICQ